MEPRELGIVDLSESGPAALVEDPVNVTIVTFE
jgi:hypothetical protein